MKRETEQPAAPLSSRGTWRVVTKLSDEDDPARSRWIETWLDRHPNAARKERDDDGLR